MTPKPAPNRARQPGRVRVSPSWIIILIPGPPGPGAGRNTRRSYPVPWPRPCRHPSLSAGYGPGRRSRYPPPSRGGPGPWPARRTPDSRARPPAPGAGLSCPGPSRGSHRTHSLPSSCRHLGNRRGAGRGWPCDVTDYRDVGILPLT